VQCQCKYNAVLVVSTPAQSPKTRSASASSPTSPVQLDTDTSGSGRQIGKRRAALRHSIIGHTDSILNSDSDDEVPNVPVSAMGRRRLGRPRKPAAESAGKHLSLYHCVHACMHVKQCFSFIR